MQIRTPDELAAVARQRRRELGLDQASLAQRAGVSRKWVIDFEKGKPRVELNLVLRVLKALDLQFRVTPLESRDRPEVPIVDIDAIIRAARGET